MVLGSEFRLSVTIPRRHQTAIRGRADACSHASTASAMARPLAQPGTPRRPRNLSVPRAGQAKRRARSVKAGRCLRRDPDPCGRARLRRIESGASCGRRRRQRIGSVRYSLGTWAASGRLLRLPKPRATAWRPIQSDEVEHPAHVSRCGIDVPDSGSFAALARDASVRPTSSPRRAEVGSTAVEHRVSPFTRVHCAGRDAAFRWAGRMPAGPPRPLQSFGRQWQKNRFGSKGSRLRHR